MSQIQEWLRSFEDAENEIQMNVKGPMLQFSSAGHFRNIVVYALMLTKTHYHFSIVRPWT